MENQNACKYNKYGHCKFGEKCIHFHNQHICVILDCDKSSCKSRHPKPCIYFLRFGQCKFGPLCSFLHSESTENKLEDEVVKLKEQVKKVVDKLSSKEIEISDLKHRIIILEKVAKPQLSCVLCDYKCHSTSGLKSHVTRSHKPEIVRDDMCDTEKNIDSDLYSEKREDENIDFYDTHDELFPVIPHSAPAPLPPPLSPPP